MRLFDLATFACTVSGSRLMPNSWFNPQVLRQRASSLMHPLNSVIVIVSMKAIWLWIHVPNVFVGREFMYSTTSSSESIILPIAERLCTRSSKTCSCSSRELFELMSRWYRWRSSENFHCRSFGAWTHVNSSQAVMYASRATPGSQPETDRLFRVSDWVRVTIHVIWTGSRITTVTLSIELI